MGTWMLAKPEHDEVTHPYYSWTFPGAPIRIQVSLDLVSRLQAELELSDDPAGAETGGVLLGRQKTLNTLEIEDFIWVSSVAEVGGPYKLDPDELERLRSVHTTRDRNAESQPVVVVGYFRIHLDTTLQLREEEAGFVAKQFRDPANAVLLIRTSSQPFTGGFFFWMKEGVFAPFSFMDFPFDADLLRLETNARSSRSRATAPVANKMPEVTLVDSAPVAEVRMSPRAADGAEASAAGEQRKPTQSEFEGARPAVTLKAPVSVGGRRAPIALAALVVLASACVSAFLTRGWWLPAPSRKDATTMAPAVVPAEPVRYPLQLDVEAQGSGLNVRWNPQSTPVLQAREGHLTILESGKQPQVIDLDPQQLATGHIFYKSSAERLQFQLEIADLAGNVSRESILALSSKPEPAVTAATAPQSVGAQAPARKVESIPIPSEAIVSSRPEPRAFTPPPPSGRGRAGLASSVVLDQPPQVAADSALPPAVGVPSVLNNLRASNPPAPPVNPVPPANPAPAANVSAAAKQLRIGGNLQSANLVKKVNPVYPPAAMSARVQGTVRFSALIGKDGTVQTLQVISGNPLFVKAATDAVKQWVYRPTMLNGEPVEITTQIDVNFTLN